MARQSITLFMWAYQQHFRIHVQVLCNSVLEALGLDGVKAKCLLVGVKPPGAMVLHELCLEPEDVPWPLSWFDGLSAAIDKNIAEHPNRDTLYGDEPSMLEKPKVIRRDAVRMAVQNALGQHDLAERVRSFAGSPAQVGGYEVVPVLQLPSDLFDHFRPLKEPITDGERTGLPSFLHAAIQQVLRTAREELLRPDPGRYLGTPTPSAEELVRRAGADFMRTISIAIGDHNYSGTDLFERFNLISSLMYEGAEGKGSLILANPKDAAITVDLEFADPVPFREPRWARKALQMAEYGTALLADCDSIRGLGTVAAGADPWLTQNVFEVEFHDHYHWSLSCGAEVLLVSRYGTPRLPKDRCPKARVVDTFRRLFAGVTQTDTDNFVAILDAAVDQGHGSMIIVAKDASEEAHRLQRQGARITPRTLTPELYKRVSKIDGTILIDPKCVCYAIGVILDGDANEQCTPARGARYNSAMRYVRTASRPSRLAVVVSDDRTVDVIPILRERVRRDVVEEQVSKLERCDSDSHRPVLAWLETHRFYLTAEQCVRVNTMMDRFAAEPAQEGEVRLLTDKFEADPACTADYFEP